MKNHTDVLIFHTGICAGASQIPIDGRRELDVLVATPSLRSGMEEKNVRTFEIQQHQT